MDVGRVDSFGLRAKKSYAEISYQTATCDFSTAPAAPLSPVHDGQPFAISLTSTSRFIARNEFDARRAAPSQARTLPHTIQSVLASARTSVRLAPTSVRAQHSSHRARLEYASAMSFAAASTMGKALVGVPVVAKKSSLRQMRASSGRRSGSKVVAMAGADAISATAVRWILAAPTMYAIVSFNEYVTHRYYQHAEFNKTDWMKKLVCLMTGKKEAPRCDGGGHIEHHAETLDDMSLKTDPKWLQSAPAKMLEDSKYRGTAFEYDVTALMVMQMIPTSVPVLALMGYSVPAMAGLILGATALHALVWNSLHPAMHGMEDIPLADGLNFPLWLGKALRKTSYYDWLYKNHTGHHVMSGRVNYNVCCPGMDHILGTYVPEEQWAPKARMPAGAETRDPYPAGEYKARLLERLEKGMVEAELVNGEELETVIAA